MSRELKKLFAFLWPLAGLFQIPFIISFFNPLYLEKNFGFSCLLHMVSTTLLLFLYRRENLKSAWPQNFFFFTALLPLFGWITSGLFFLGILRGEFDEATLPETHEEEVFSEIPPIEELKIPIKQSLQKALDIMPLSDVLAGTDIHLKRSAIEKLTDLKTEEAVKLLNHYRTDPSPDIRFFITSALTRLKKEFDEELESAKQEMQNNIYKISARIFLAKTYLKYSRSGLLDATIARAYDQEALYHLHFSIQSDHASLEAFELLISIFSERHDWDKALSLVDYMERTSKLLSVECLKIKITIFFHRGDYLKVVPLIRDLKKEKVETEWNSALLWW